jgi:iron complex outermembrane receptor protein
LRFGSQAIGGVVETTNNRIPQALPCVGDPSRAVLPAGIYKAPPLTPVRPCVSVEMRGALTSVDNGANGAILLDAGGDHVALHADAFGRTASNYFVPNYPYLTAPDPVEAPNATQPGAFNGRQPNSSLRNDGQSIGASYIFDGGFFGVALTRNAALYHIPGFDGEDHHTRIDAHQTKLLSKGEWRAPNSAIDAVRFWAGVTDYKHNEIGLADNTDLTSDGVRQTFTNKEQEARVEVQLAPVNLRFAAWTTALGVQGGHQELTAPSPDGAGLWDPNSNRRIAGYMFHEFKFSATTKAQVAARVEQVDLSGSGRFFPAPGVLASTPTSVGFTPKSASVGLIQNLPWDLVASATAQYVERAPKPAELFSGGVHDATVTFDKGNPNLKIETAQSIEVGLRRANGPFRFEVTAYYTKFKGFIYRRLTGNTCDEAGDCTMPAELNEAIYSQNDATFRGGEFQSQWEMFPLGGGVFGIENQFDVVRATFTDGSNVPRIPPMRVGGGIFWRDPNWFGRVNLLHAFAQDDIAVIGETPTPGYDDLRAELSYRRKFARPASGEPREVTVGISGTNLLNQNIRNSVSYTKDVVLMPGAGVRLFANVKY